VRYSYNGDGLVPNGDTYTYDPARFKNELKRAAKDDSAPSLPEERVREIMKVLEKLKQIIGKYFSIYDIRWTETAAAFYCHINMDTLDDQFDELRKEIVPVGYIPMLARENGEHIIYITRRAPLRTRGIWVNILLLFATIFCTVWAGAIWWFSYAYADREAAGFINVLLDRSCVIYGSLFFALPLMLILGVHELGHYFMARKHKVAASLPFFIPVPPVFLFPLGTFGAFISMREPIPNKRSLLDIGVGGPIAGFIVAVIVTLTGLVLTKTYQLPAPEPTGEVLYMGPPLLFIGFERLIPIPEGVAIHPMVFAGWVGLLVTAMNLLPAGQLDGGHIARALFGESSKYLSYGAVIALIALGMLYSGWFIFAFLILVLGTRHPPPLNDLSRLNINRKVLGAFTIIILIICFVPRPLWLGKLPEYRVELLCDTNETSIDIDDTVTYVITVKNNGNVDDDFKLNITANVSVASNVYEKSSSTASVNATVMPNLTHWEYTLDRSELKRLRPGKSEQINLCITTYNNATYGEILILKLSAWSTHAPKRAVTLTLYTIVSSIKLYCEEKKLDMVGGGKRSLLINVTNLYNGTDVINLTVIERHIPPYWEITIREPTVTLGSNCSVDVVMIIAIPENITTRETAIILIKAVSINVENSIAYTRVLIDAKPS
jgi:Zn-dependent protease